MSSIPPDHTVEDLRRGIASININEVAKKLKKALAITRRAGDTEIDGYPTSTPGNGATSSTRGRTITVDDETGTPDHVPITSVEAAAIQRLEHGPTTRDRHLELTLSAYAALDAATLSLQRCARILGQIDALTDTTDLNPDEPGCWAMARINKWEPIHRRTPIDGDVIGLGRFAYEYYRSTGELPTKEQCQAHHDGRKVMRPVQPASAQRA